MRKTYFSKFVAATAVMTSMVFGSGSMLVMAAEDVPARVAPSNDTYSITLDKATPNGDYSLYQLFTGTYTSADNTMMGDAVVNPDLKSIIVDAIKTQDPTFALSGPDAQQAIQMTGALESIQSGTNGDVNIQNLANVIAKNVTSATPMKTGTATADGTLTFSDLPSGYYLVVSSNGDSYAGPNGAFTRAILVPLNGDKTITTKTTDVSSFAKNALVDGKEVPLADVSIVDGKVVTPSYSIDATVNGLYQYDEFPLFFTDNLPEGLTTTTEEVNSEWNVKVTATLGTETKDITTAYKNSVATTGSSSVITFGCTNLKTALTAAGFTADQVNGFDSQFKITLTYTPVYTADDIDAIFGKESVLTKPLVNAATAHFPRDPYNKGTNTVKPDGTLNPDTTTDTPPKEVNTYSYNLTINKIGPDKQALTGAKFALSEDGTAAGKDITADDNGTFTFTGLAAGKTYTITETQVPAGMEKIEPISFTITEIPNDPGTAIVSITGAVTSDLSKASTITSNGSNVILTVANVAGHKLPTTGMPGMAGMGLAGAAVAGGLIYLVITRKKKTD